MLRRGWILISADVGLGILAFTMQIGLKHSDVGKIIKFKRRRLRVVVATVELKVAISLLDAGIQGLYCER